jgi:hypothetical protein
MTRARDNSFNPFNNQVAGKNAVINGAFDFWQRGVSINGSANGTYTSDRWSTGRSGSALTVTRQTTSDTTNLPSIQYCARVQRDSGNTSTGPGYIIQPIESSNSTPFAGKTVTLSFYARKGADYSTTNSWLNPSLWSGTGIDQNPWSGYTNTTNLINSNVVLTTVWQRYTLTSTVGSTATELLVQFGFSPTGTAGTNDYFEITGVQLEIGSSATHFSRAGGTIGGELSLCQRYYQKSYSQGTNPATNNSPGAEVRMGASRTDQYATDSSFSFPVAMRIPPAVLLYSSTNSTVNSIYDAGAGVNRSAAVFNIGDNRAQIGLGSGVTTTANTAYVWHWVASAEL